MPSYDIKKLEGRIDTFFRDIVCIDSESGNEKEVSEFIEKEMKRLGMKTFSDDTISLTGSNTGNLIGYLSGQKDETLILSAHLDTVKPGNGIEVIFENGSYKSAGDTIVAADDKAGITIILKAVEAAVEQGVELPNMEILFTVCEEIGLIGAKHLDLSKLQSKHAIILDSTDTDIIITNAPAASRFKISVKGLAAHAGVSPENGINAIQLAAKAITKIPMGRIDSETTVNIGTINGGMATNIVAPLVTLEGEVRSHSTEKLKNLTKQIHTVFKEEIRMAEKKDNLPQVDFEIYEDFPLLNADDNGRLVATLKQAGKKFDRKLTTGSLGGGSDANILAGKGIDSVVIGTGMKNPHSTDESISMKDMIDTTLLLIETISSFKQQSE